MKNYCVIILQLYEVNSNHQRVIGSLLLWYPSLVRIVLAKKTLAVLINPSISVTHHNSDALLTHVTTIEATPDQHQFPSYGSTIPRFLGHLNQESTWGKIGEAMPTSQSQSQETA